MKATWMPTSAMLVISWFVLSTPAATQQTQRPTSQTNTANCSATDCCCQVGSDTKCTPKGDCSTLGGSCVADSKCRTGANLTPQSLGTAITPGQQTLGKTERKLTDAKGCIYLSEAGNATFTYWANSCPEPMQFTIQWYGVSPPRNVTYRTNNRPYVRTVLRQDTNGALIDEAPAKTGLGAPTSRVRIEERNMGEGQTLVSLVNGEAQPVFVGGFITVLKGGHEVRRCLLNILVAVVGRERACVLFTGEQYVPVLVSELDPK